MKAVFLAVLFPFLFLPAIAQNVRWDSTASTTNGAGTAVPILAMPGSSVAFFNACTSDPCSPTRATTYTSATASTTCPSGAQIVWQLPYNQACTSYADAHGAFGGYFQPGAYLYTYSKNGLTYGPFFFNVIGALAPGSPWWIDPRSFGAKCDGVTDDHAALQASLNVPGYNVVLIPSGLTCMSSTQLTISGNNGSTNTTNSLQVEGTLKLSSSIATPFIALGSKTSWVAPPAGYSRSVTISGGGTIDANYNAPIAIDVVNGNDIYITLASVQNATLFGVLGGDSTVTCTAAHCYHSQIYLGGNTTVQLVDPTRAGSGSWGNCTTSLSPPGFTALTHAAAAICMDTASDNVIDSTVLTIGYPVGASIHSGDNRISFHPWAATFSPNVGHLQIGVDDYAIGTQISNCYIDTPQVFGIWEHSFNAVIDNCTFFELNGFAPDNIATGVYFSQAGPFASVTNSRFEGGTSSRMASDITVSGGVLASMQFSGNSVVSNVVDRNSGANLIGLNLNSQLQFLSSAGTVNWTLGPDNSNGFRVHDNTGSLDRIVLFPNGSSGYFVPSGQAHTFNINNSAAFTVSTALYTFTNPFDTPMNVHFDTGSAATQTINIDLNDQGTTFWDIQKDSTNNFRIHDVVANLDRLALFSNGFTFFEVPTGNGFKFLVGSNAVAEVNPSGAFLSLVGTAVASASTISIANPITHITGTTPIVNITPPSGCTTTGTGCQITLIPDALGSTTAAGNIALATTFVVGRALIMTYDQGAVKWYPSY